MKFGLSEVEILYNPKNVGVEIHPRIWCDGQYGTAPDADVFCENPDEDGIIVADIGIDVIIVYGEKGRKWPQMSSVWWYYFEDFSQYSISHAPEEARKVALERYRERKDEMKTLRKEVDPQVLRKVHLDRLGDWLRISEERTEL